MTPKRNIKRHKFTFEEDLKLRKLVLSSGDDIDWERISSKMGNKLSTRQCRERYRNYLSPHLNHGPWSKEEDEILFIKFSELGPHWSKMVKFFKGRSEASIKNHYAKLNYKSRKEEEKPKQEKKLVLKAGEFESLIDPINDFEFDTIEDIFMDSDFLASLWIIIKNQENKYFFFLEFITRHFNQVIHAKSSCIWVRRLVKIELVIMINSFF